MKRFGGFSCVSCGGRIQVDSAGYFIHKCRNSNTKPKSWKDRISSKLGL